MIRRPPRSTLFRSSAASDVYKRQLPNFVPVILFFLIQFAPAVGFSESVSLFPQPLCVFSNIETLGCHEIVACCGSHVEFANRDQCGCLNLVTGGKRVLWTVTPDDSMERLVCVLWSASFLSRGTSCFPTSWLIGVAMFPLCRGGGSP